MKNVIALFVAVFLFSLFSCHRPVAYFQRTPHLAAARQTVDKPTVVNVHEVPNPIDQESQPVTEGPLTNNALIVSSRSQPAQETGSQVHHRMQRVKSLLAVSTAKKTNAQPEPKPKKKLKLGNQIRQSLGMRLRPELNWWQRISWKLKASVLVILVAVVFAILHITILAIIFGILGALLLMSGLKKSFKVRRPWF